MSLLLIDVGNTKLKWCFENGQQVLFGEMPSEKGLEQALEGVAERIGIPCRIGLSCVKSNQYEQQLVALLKAVFNRDPFVAKVSRAACGVECSYPEPTRMGVDRWLAMISVRHQVSGAFCVIDCGSAVTFDWVSAAGSHQGGYILPGLRLSIEALLQGTDQVIVDYDKLSDATLCPGSNTTDAVYNGAMFSLVAQAASAYEYLLQLAGQGECVLVITGGDAALLSANLACPHRFMDGLVFDGLKVMMGIDLSCDTLPETPDTTVGGV